jgi:transmembrane sensor
MKTFNLIRNLRWRFSKEKATEQETNEFDELLKKIPREGWNNNYAWNRLQRKIQDSETSDSESYNAQQKVKIKTITPAIQFARVTFAVILIAVVSYLAINQFGLFQHRSENLTSRTISTELGNIKQIVLGDGSVVILNAASTLQISSGFGSTNREVQLSGEAYFEVVHNSAVPFIVRTNRLTVTDLGTIFDLKAFSDEENNSVALLKGTIEVHKSTKDETANQNILQPGQQYTYNKTTDKSNIGAFDTQQVTGWKDNVLVFTNTALLKVFKVLERAYGVKFQLEDEGLKDLKITANFNQASFWTVVKALKSLTGLEYKTIGDQEKLKEIIFYKK